jgi:hypothetical protein
MAEAVEGERNHVLYWCANRVIDDWLDDRFDDEAYMEHLEDLHDVAYAAGLPDWEIEQTINSARKRQ